MGRIEKLLSGGQKLHISIERLRGFGLLFGIERLAGTEPGHGNTGGGHGRSQLVCG